MKRSFAILVLGVILLSFVLCLCGCSQPGETTDEGARRHQRMMTVNQQQMMEDIDKALLLHEPSKLTERRIP
ncbi:MAG: hypothetical protein ACYSUK_02510 [Planctomycetota bacterium]